MVNSPTFVSTSKWIILRVNLFATNNAILPRFFFPLLYRSKRVGHKNIFLRFIFFVFVATIVVAWNHTTIITKLALWIFISVRFHSVLHNFYTYMNVYIYTFRNFFFFFFTKFIKRKQSSGLWQLLIDPDLNLIILFGWTRDLVMNFWINPWWGYDISILA